jgi:hypothetical protein
MEFLTDKYFDVNALKRSRIPACHKIDVGTLYLRGMKSVNNLINYTSRLVLLGW